MDGVNNQKRQRHPLVRVGVVLLLSYGVCVGLLALFEQRIIFLPPSQFPSTQVREVGPDVQDLQIAVDKATHIHAWWIPSDRSSSSTMLFFDGNAGVLERDAKGQIEILRRTGANLLLIDYRGYGSSSKFDTTAASTRKDAQAAFDYLVHVRKLSAQQIVLFGWSIGSGVATQLALDRPEAGGLVLLSPITSVSDVGNNASLLFRYVLRPAQWLRHDNDFANKDKIKAVHMPLLIMSGSNDTLAPPWMAQQLYDRAEEPKSLYFLPETGHADAMTKAPQAFVARLNMFLKPIYGKHP